MIAGSTSQATAPHPRPTARSLPADARADLCDLQHARRSRRSRSPVVRKKHRSVAPDPDRVLRLLTLGSPSDPSEPLRNIGRFPSVPAPRFHRRLPFNHSVRKGEIRLRYLPGQMDLLLHNPAGRRAMPFTRQSARTGTRRECEADLCLRLGSEGSCALLGAIELSPCKHAWSRCWATSNTCWKARAPCGMSRKSLQALFGPSESDGVPNGTRTANCGSPHGRQSNTRTGASE